MVYSQPNAYCVAGRRYDEDIRTGKDVGNRPTPKRRFLIASPGRFNTLPTLVVVIEFSYQIFEAMRIEVFEVDRPYVRVTPVLGFVMF